MAAEALLLLLALAFLPALLYLSGLALRHRGPSATTGAVGFLYGASLSLVVLAGLYLLLALLLGDPVRAFQGFFAERLVNEEAQRDFVVVVVLAPLLEELAKGLGVWLLAARIRRGADGAFLGAAVGLGFAGTETFFYLAAAASDAGSELAGAALATVVLVAMLRSVTAAFLHPAATGLTGYGIARARLRGVPVLLAALPFYGLAVFVHGLYNYLAAFLPPQTLGGVALEVNLPAAVLLAFLAWGALKRGVAARA